MPNLFCKSRPIRALLIAAAAVLLLLLLSAAANSGRIVAEANTTYLPARVVEVLSRDEQRYGEDDAMRDITVTFTAQLEDGEAVTAIQTISDSVVMGEIREVEPGSRVILMNNAPPEEAPNYVMTTFVRTNVLICLGVIFALLLILFGRSKGLAALAALVLTCAAVFVCFIPAVLSGKNIYFWTILICAYITIFTLLLI
ncbi:MAG: YibE/F family protein, partial [Clostridia bacterium]|nr:YibE/F family protein [Clostridia bacterium]